MRCWEIDGNCESSVNIYSTRMSITRKSTKIKDHRWKYPEINSWWISVILWMLGGNVLQQRTQQRSGWERERESPYLSGRKKTNRKLSDKWTLGKNRRNINENQGKRFDASFCSPLLDLLGSSMQSIRSISNENDWTWFSLNSSR